MTDILTAMLWLAGSAFALLAAVGVLRMPDVFTRMQASTKASTLGLACLLLGTALQMADFASLIRAASIGHDPAEMAATVVYLCSPAGGYLTGKVLEVDGGLDKPSLDLGLPDLS